MAKWLTIRTVEAIEWYRRDIVIVFSGRRGFHIHVFDSDPHEWTQRRRKSITRFHADAKHHFAIAIAIAIAISS